MSVDLADGSLARQRAPSKGDSPGDQLVKFSGIRTEGAFKTCNILLMVVTYWSTTLFPVIWG